MPRLFGRTYTRTQLQDLTGDMSQLAYARRSEFVEGNERGAGLIDPSRGKPKRAGRIMGDHRQKGRKIRIQVAGQAPKAQGVARIMLPQRAECIADIVRRKDHADRCVPQFAHPGQAPLHRCALSAPLQIEVG